MEHARHIEQVGWSQCGASVMSGAIMSARGARVEFDNRIDVRVRSFESRTRESAIVARNFSERALKSRWGDLYDFCDEECERFATESYTSSAKS
jgi:hypothetical protein